MTVTQPGAPDDDATSPHTEPGLPYSRVALAAGGLLTAASTVVPWISAPLIGGISLWRLHSLVADLARIGQAISTATDGTPGTGHAGTLVLFLPVGVLLLGVGSILLAVTAASRSTARVGAWVIGAVTAATGAAGIIVTTAAPHQTQGLVSMAAGPFVLTAGGLITMTGGLAKAHPPAPGPTGGARRLGAVAGYLASFVGVALLVAFAAIATTRTAPATTPAPPAAAAPTPTPTPPPASVTEPTVTTPTTTAPPTTRAASSPTQVVGRYFDAINAGDYRRAWQLGGKNLNSTYSRFVAGFSHTAQDTWSTTSVDGDTVTGTLAAQQTNGTTTYFSGYYQVRHGIITAAHLTQG